MAAVRSLVDLHIHLGRSRNGQWIKIPAGADLTFENVLRESGERKGLSMVAIVDCHAPEVIEEIEELLADGRLTELAQGGFRYCDQVTVIPASEVEAVESAGALHAIAYLPTLETTKAFSRWLAGRVSNINLSTQRARLSGSELAGFVDLVEGFLIPAHIFTPYKSLYGSCASSIWEVFSVDQRPIIPAVELGLSADTEMADSIPELRCFSFVSNSDAHSLAKIGREYNEMLMLEQSFAGLLAALTAGTGTGTGTGTGIRVGTDSPADSVPDGHPPALTGNFGLDPRLGKYYRTCCRHCGWLAEGRKAVMGEECPKCGSGKVIRGVRDRVAHLAGGWQSESPPFRPTYTRQVPLQFMPGIGPKTLSRLLAHFGSEMTILHKTPETQLVDVVGSRLTRLIMEARAGALPIQPGGGGKYGKVLAHGPA